MTLTPNTDPLITVEELETTDKGNKVTQDIQSQSHEKEQQRSSQPITNLTSTMEVEVEIQEDGKILTQNHNQQYIQTSDKQPVTDKTNLSQGGNWDTSPN